MHVSPGQVVAAATLAVKIANKMQIGSSLLAKWRLHLAQLLKWDAVEVISTNLIIYPLLVQTKQLMFHVKENIT